MRLEHLLSGTVRWLKADGVVKCGFYLLFDLSEPCPSRLGMGDEFFDLRGMHKTDDGDRRSGRIHNTQVRASGGCLWLLVARKDVASDEMLRGPAGRG